MAIMVTCRWCGRQYDASHNNIPGYCSNKCKEAAKKAKESSSGGGSSSGYSGADSDSLIRGLKLIGIALMAVVTVLTAVFYVFPKFLKGKNKKFLYAYIITWVVLIAGAAVYFSFFSPKAVSGIKIEIVSASCKTEEEFVSLFKESISGVSVTMLEGEEFATYANQALNAVKERNSSFNDSVYFVRLPDSVNAYLWFETKDQPKGYIYRTK